MRVADQLGRGGRGVTGMSVELLTAGVSCEPLIRCPNPGKGLCCHPVYPHDRQQQIAPSVALCSFM